MADIVATTKTPEGAVAGFMEAWRRRDFTAAAQWCQAHWYVAERDPVGLVKSWYGWTPPILRWKYLRTRELDSPWPLREVTVHVTFRHKGGLTCRLAFICGHDRPDGQPVPVGEVGAWGPNPSSGLRGLPRLA